MADSDNTEDEHIGVEGIFFHPYHGEERRYISAHLGNNGLILTLIGEDSWIEMSPLAAKCFLEDIADATGESIDLLARSSSRTKESDKNKRFSVKEKNTLLVLIGALCKASNIDPNQRGVSAALAKMTEELGAPITDDTIRKVLAQITSAVETRST